MSEARQRAKNRNPTEADAPQMVELLKKAFDRWPAFELQAPALDHLRWKMRSDPIAARHHWVSEVDGRVAAMLLRIIRRIRVRGRDYLARDGVDAAADPLYQGQRLYSSMLDHLRQSPQDAEFDLGISYSTNPKVQHRDRRKGRQPLGNPLQVLHKPYRARAIVARRRDRYGGAMPALLAVARIRLETVFNRVGHRPYRRLAERTWSITTLERFDDRIDGFFDEAARPFEFAVVRSKDYMNWRYCDPAAGRFTVRVAEQEGRLLGYQVLKLSEGSGYIADLLALPQRVDVIRSLIEEALDFFRDAGVDFVTCWMISRHPYNGILRRYGFIDSGRDVGLVYETLGVDRSVLGFLADADARIHLTHGDSDWI